MSKTVRSIEPKPWSQMSDPGSRFLALDLTSRTSGPRSWVRVLNIRPGSLVPGPRSWIPVHSVLITKFDKKIFQSLTGIANCDSYYKV